MVNFLVQPHHLPLFHHARHDLVLYVIHAPPNAGCYLLDCGIILGFAKNQLLKLLPAKTGFAVKLRGVNLRARGVNLDLLIKVHTNKEYSLQR